MTDHTTQLLTFQDLRQADKLQSVSLKKIARICLNSLRRQESDVDVYEFLFTKVLYLFDPEEFETNVSLVLLPELGKHLHKIAVELEDNALSCFMIDNLKSLLAIANILLKFTEYVVGTSETYQFYKSIVIFLEFLIRSYEVIRQHIHTNNPGTNEDDMVKQLFTVCQKIHHLVSNLLAPPTGSGQYFQHLDLKDEFECLKNVIDHFCKIGSITIGIDTRLSTEVWKAVVKLISTYDKQIVANDTTWLHDHVLGINDEVEKFFKTLLDCMQISKNGLIKLKFNGLLLKVLLKILMLIKEEFNNYETLLNTSVAIENTLLTKNFSKELIEAVRQHLTVGYMNLFGLVFRHSNFAKALSSTDYQSTEEIIALNKIVMYVISKLVTEDRNTTIIDLYIVRNNLLSTCIRHLSRSHLIFNQHEGSYNELLSHIAVFVLICAKKDSRSRQKILEETLVGMILQDSYWVGVAGLDVWSIYLRFQSVWLLWSYFKFWKVINDEFSVFVSQPKAVFVGRLLQNLFVFLPSSMQQKVWTEYPISNKKNCKLWITIGLDKVDNQLVAGVKNMFAQHLTEFCSVSLTQITPQKLYETMYTINLISSLDDRNMFETIAPELVMLLEALSVSKNDIVKTNSLICTFIIVTKKLTKHAICIPNLIRTNIFQDMCSLSLSSKFNFLYKNEQILEQFRNPLTSDCNMLIKAMASCHDQNCTAPVSRDQLGTILSYQIEQDRISHCCQSHTAASNVTNYFDCSFDDTVLASALMDSDTDRNPKRQKLDTVLKPDCCPTLEEPCIATDSIGVLNGQVQILQRLHGRGVLSEDHIDQINRIGFVLSTLGH
ncbi:uncharacterized protein LOC131690951 [Topomyia yanbarensis]|uniref:uncharacterized protein LOC131690951 n=1 Tax=Topomyia yanbarensis TaxID=2498891 RepID=UPI00273CB5E6|nr:uncharacterized protein LOC131690951 [Topomyia yanbarensis]